MASGVMLGSRMSRRKLLLFCSKFGPMRVKCDLAWYNLAPFRSTTPVVGQDLPSRYDLGFECFSCLVLAKVYLFDSVDTVLHLRINEDMSAQGIRRMVLLAESKPWSRQYRRCSSISIAMNQQFWVFPDMLKNSSINAGFSYPSLACNASTLIKYAQNPPL